MEIFFDPSKLSSPFFTHKKSYRKISGYEIEGEKIYIKEYLKNFEEAEREWQNLQILKKEGFLVPTPLFFKREKDRAFLVTEALRGIPLSELLLRTKEPEIYWKILSKLLSELHKKGFFHQDCYLNHFYWNDTTKTLSFLDVARVKRGGLFSFYYQIKDLSQIGYSFEEYLGERGPQFFDIFLRFYEKNYGRLSFLKRLLIKIKIAQIRKRTLRRRLEGRPL